MKEITIERWKAVLKNAIKTNLKLGEEGVRCAAQNIIGLHGLGKSTSCVQVGEELGMYTKVINLAEIEKEDFIGMPAKEYEMSQIHGDVVKDTQWVDKELMPHLKSQGYSPTLRTRTKYSLPDWLAEQTEPMILVLDDESRCSGELQQAVMALKLDQTYAGWTLPAGSTVVCTNNPSEDINYTVRDSDKAQEDRSFNYNLKFSLDNLTKYLEGRIDDRLLNFLISEGEDIVIRNNPATKKDEIFTSPRALEAFGHAIKFVSDFSSLENTETVLDLGNAALPEGVAKRFVDFIVQKIGQLPKPSFVFTSADPVAVITALTGDPKTPEFRADIASIMAKRIAHYLTKHSDPVSESDKKKLHDLITSKCLLEDNNYYVIRCMHNVKRSRWATFLTHPEIVQQYEFAG